jgi:hypothetical protein
MPLPKSRPTVPCHASSIFLAVMQGYLQLQLMQLQRTPLPDRIHKLLSLIREACLRAGTVLWLPGGIASLGDTVFVHLLGFR